MKNFVAMFTAGLLASCLSNDPDTQPPDAGDDVIEPTPKIESMQDGADWVAEIDASSDQDLVYLKLDTGEEVWGEDGSPPADWDLSFVRYHIHTNGGTNGSGGAEGMFIPSASADSILKAPSHGYWEDSPDGDDEGGDPDTVFLGNGGWYSYDAQTHLLTPKEQIYIVYDGSSKYFAVTIESYYNEASSPANFTIRWREILPPTAEVTFQSGDGASWYHVDFQNGEVSPATPETSAEWDIAVSRTLFRTNSGTSGTGQGGAKFLAAGTDYDAVTATDAGEFAVDAELAVPGPPPQTTYSGNPNLADWYDYDPNTHVVSPKDLVGIVKGADGEPYKFRITAFADGKISVRYEHITLN